MRINKSVSSKSRSGIFFAGRLDGKTDWPFDLPVRQHPSAQPQRAEADGGFGRANSNEAHRAACV